MTDREQLLERIRKLRERARRDVGAEARSARNLARTLMREHGITAADLELTDAPHIHVERAPANAPPRKARIPVKVRVNVLGFDIRRVFHL